MLMMSSPSTAIAIVAPSTHAMETTQCILVDKFDWIFRKANIIGE